MQKDRYFIIHGCSVNDFVAHYEAQQKNNYLTFLSSLSLNQRHHFPSFQPQVLLLSKTLVSDLLWVACAYLPNLGATTL